MAVSVFMPPDVKIKVFIQDAECNKCGAKEEFWVEKHEDAYIHPFYKMKETTKYVNVVLYMQGLQNRDNLETFYIDFHDPDLGAKGVDLEVQRLDDEEVKIYVKDFEDKYYEFNERNWPDTPNDEFIEPCRVNDFFFNIIRKKPDVISIYEESEEEE